MEGKNNKAFTLVELLVVVAIIGILSTVIVISFNNAQEKARVSKAVSDIKVITNAASVYKAQNEEFPPDYLTICHLYEYRNNLKLNSLLNNNGCVYNFAKNIVTGTRTISDWAGPYTSTFFKHPWGGHIAFTTYTDSLGKVGFSVFLDEDRTCPDNLGCPTGSAISFYNDNKAIIPDSSLQAIDNALDDGNIKTGCAKENTTLGEISVRFFANCD